MAGEIFLSYRRSDASDAFRKLLQRLSQAFGEASIVYDRDRIAAGADFTRVIADTMKYCKVGLVVIGPNWASERNTDGIPKLHDPRDYVREEVGQLLRAEVPVIPILLDQGTLPRTGILPEDLSALTSVQPARLRDDNLATDLDDLHTALEKVLGRRRKLSFFRRSRPQLRPQARPRGTNIFISYRRKDTAEVAKLLYETLTNKYPHSKVFLDIDTIPYATSFRAHITSAIEQSCVLLALIGPDWMNTSWHRRIWAAMRRAEDFVQVEIEAASDLRVPIFPLLVNGAQMPHRRHLPLNLAELPSLNAAQLRTGPFFSVDIARVLSQVDAFHQAGVRGRAS